MAKRGARTKYTPEMMAEIVKLLSAGCVVADVCAKLGFHVDTYYEWIKQHPEFSEAVKRAKADANAGAVLSMRKAMMPHDVSSRTTKTISETRLRKVKDKDGFISEQPYTYTKTEESSTLSNEFDWRAALEYLKRRDPDNWAEHLIIKVKPDEDDLLKKAGFKAASDAWEALMNNIRAEYSDNANANR